MCFNLKRQGHQDLNTYYPVTVFVLIENHQKGTGLAELYSKHVKVDLKPVNMEVVVSSLS